MRIYSVNGQKAWFADGEAPTGAILLTKEKKTQPVEAPVVEAPVETKARKKPANKSRKAGSNK